MKSDRLRTNSLLHVKNSIAEKTIQNFSSSKYLSWLYDIGIVAKLNAWRTEMRILPSYHYNFVHVTIEVLLFDLYWYIVPRPMRYRWDNYTGFPRDLYIVSHGRDSNLEMRKKCHLFELFFRSVCPFVSIIFSLFEGSFLRIAYCFITRENSQQRWTSGRGNNWLIGDWKYIGAFEGKYSHT